MQKTKPSSIRILKCSDECDQGPEALAKSCTLANTLWCEIRSADRKLPLKYSVWFMAFCQNMVITVFGFLFLKVGNNWKMHIANIWAISLICQLWKRQTSWKGNGGKAFAIRTRQSNAGRTNSTVHSSKRNICNSCSLTMVLKNQNKPSPTPLQVLPALLGQGHCHFHEAECMSLWAQPWHSCPCCYTLCWSGASLCSSRVAASWYRYVWQPGPQDMRGAWKPIAFHSRWSTGVSRTIDRPVGTCRRSRGRLSG